MSTFDDEAKLNLLDTQKERFNNLKIIADHSNSPQFKKIVSEIIAGALSPFEASMLPEFGQTVAPLMKNVVMSLSDEADSEPETRVLSGSADRQRSTQQAPLPLANIVQPTPPTTPATPVREMCDPDELWQLGTEERP